MKLTDLAKLVSTNISQGRAHFDVAVYQPPEGHGCTLVTEVCVRDEACPQYYNTAAAGFPRS